jgi:hypothetical protein
MSSDTPYGETVVPAGDLTDPDATHDESARRYERGQEIGEGTFGVVYKTTHPYLKRTVALKVLKQQCQASLATVERFKREAGAQDGLHGPNFCQVFDLYQEHGQWHLAIEFIDGPTLERRIKDGLEVDEAVEIVAKLARAMQLAHDEDIVHRDLKPANVMFRPADGSGSHNVPVIMDFGLCRCDDGHNLTADGEFLGTPAYMSPEQARGETESIGPHSDQFGLAVILYEMLCGHLPFQAKPISALLRQICDEDPPAPWRNDQPLAAKLSAALLTALHKEPDQRHGCMADFALALEDCLPRPSRPAVRTRRPAAVCHNLPFRSLGPLFKGRDAALMALREKLDQAAGHATAIVAAQLIHGLGGVGKSRLAVEFAWQHQAHYSALLFVTADSSGNLQAGLAGLCDILQLPEREATDQHTLLAAVLNWLADHSDWLLILDNVDDQHAALAVQEFVADLDGGDVLITGRWTAFGHSIQTMELGVLDDSEAAAYLLDVTVDRRKATDSDADDALALATRLDCLAVALEHAGAYIGRHRCSITDYQQAWEENIHDTADWYDPLTQNYPHSVLAAWVTTVDKLSPAARALVDRLSWLATEPLPACLLDDSRDAANELVDYSMLKWSPESDTWQMHRVVQEVTRSRIPAADRRESLQATLQAVNAVAPIDSYDVRTWDVWNPLRPHVTRIIIHVDQHDIPEPRSLSEN